MKKNLKNNINHILKGKDLLSKYVFNEKTTIYLGKEKIFKYIELELLKDSVDKNKNEKCDVKNYLEINTQFDTRKK